MSGYFVSYKPLQFLLRQYSFNSNSFNFFLVLWYPLRNFQKYASSMPGSITCMLARRLNLLQRHVNQNKVRSFSPSLGAESADLYLLASFSFSHGRAGCPTNASHCRLQLNLLVVRPMPPITSTVSCLMYHLMSLLSYDFCRRPFRGEEV
jgi:hypothetical protein